LSSPLNECNSIRTNLNHLLLALQSQRQQASDEAADIGNRLEVEMESRSQLEGEFASAATLAEAMEANAQTAAAEVDELRAELAQYTEARHLQLNDIDDVNEHAGATIPAEEHAAVTGLMEELQLQRQALEDLRSQQGRELEAADGWARTKAHEHTVLLGELAKAHSTIEYLRAERTLGRESSPLLQSRSLHVSPHLQRRSANAHIPHLHKEQSSITQQLVGSTIQSTSADSGLENISHKALQLETLRWQHAARVEAAECGSLKALNAIAKQRETEAVNQVDEVVQKCAARYEKLKAKMSAESATAREELETAKARLVQATEKHEVKVQGLETVWNARVKRLTVEKEDLVEVYEKQLRDASENHKAALSTFQAQSSLALAQCKEQSRMELAEAREVMEQAHVINVHNIKERMFSEQTEELERLAAESAAASRESAEQFEEGLAQLHATLQSESQQRLSALNQLEKANLEAQAQDLEISSLRRQLESAEESVVEQTAAMERERTISLEEFEDFKADNAKTRQALIAAWEQRLFLSEHNQHVNAEKAMEEVEARFAEERDNLESQLQAHHEELLRYSNDAVSVPHVLGMCECCQLNCQYFFCRLRRVRKFLH